MYGGTFDPVHNGHVIVALRMMEILALDKLIVMPAYIPPHKVERKRVEFSERFEWLKRAFYGVKKVEISDFEGKKGDVSYTFDTVSHFEKEYGKLVYIIGEDNFLTIDKWYKHEELLKKVELWVYPRVCGFDDKMIEKWASISKDIHFAREVPLIQISSTVVRQRIKNGLPIRGYVPQSIEGEIWKAYSEEEKENV